MKWEEACQTLGVATTATPTEMHAQYIYKAQLLHPDKTAGLPEKARQKAEEELKVINAAYTVLKDPKNNAVTIPPKLKVVPRHISFTNVESGQQKTTHIQIESVGGSYTKFWMADAPAPWLKVIEAKSTTNDPLPLEVTIEATGDSALQEHSQCNLPIRLENEKTKTKDEVSIKIELLGVKKYRKDDLHKNSSTNIGKFALSTRYKALLLLFIPSVIGLIINAFIRNLIPFYILLGFSAIYLIEKWFGYPVRKHKTIGMLYRLILNLGILSYLGFVVWSGVQLFSQQFAGTPLTGSLVFLLECGFFLWLWWIVSKNSWRFPSMKLTLFALVAIFLVFSFAGVQPFSTYKDKYYPDVVSFFDTSSK
jgi:DnaJ domain